MARKANAAAAKATRMEMRRRELFMELVGLSGSQASRRSAHPTPSTGCYSDDFLHGRKNKKADAILASAFPLRISGGINASCSG